VASALGQGQRNLAIVGPRVRVRAVVEQEFHQLRIATRHRLVKGRAARAIAVVCFRSGGQKGGNEEGKIAIAALEQKDL
jgi:hypothetical protein